MIEIIIEKAAPTRGVKPSEDVTIKIHNTGHDWDAGTTKESMAVFKIDADVLCEALHSSLPGGTFAQLLSLMLEKRASHFIVSFGDREKKS